MADKITIKSNWRARPVLAFVDLPRKEQADFDYLDDEDTFMPRFVRYLGRWHDVAEFSPIHSGNRATFGVMFDGYFSEAFSSGVLVRFVDDHAIMARYYC